MEAFKRNGPTRNHWGRSRYSAAYSEHDGPQ